MTRIEKIKKLREIFGHIYPDAQCSLQYRDPFQLLVSTQLAAQCTDARVNIVTKDLFAKYKTVKDFAEADLKELEQDIKSTGFYHNKAKNIIAASQKILTDFGGEVPKTMEELLSLPGTGRKTANLVLGDAFGIPGIVIDTHAKRLSGRIGLTKEEDPKKIELDLAGFVPKDYWSAIGHHLVYHGRAVCKAQKPNCTECEVSHLCDYYKNANK
ncbi:MAG: endonuclease III [Bacillota bacterium]|nr:endonuclease III [Bacillota bacterium]